MSLNFDSNPSNPSSGGTNLVRYRASHRAMATTFDVCAYGGDQEYLAAVVNDVFDEIDRLEHQLSSFRSESELSYINRAAGRHRVVVEPGLFRLVRDALRYSSETRGAFDITVGRLMRSWGYFREQGRVPADDEILQTLKTVGSGHVKLHAATRTLWFDGAGVQLDLGGIGKGFAVDRAADILRSSGVTKALISSGTSSIYALGAPPDATAWTISLRDPFDPEKIADVVYLKNCSISTSGGYEKCFKENGKAYAHILDPATGRPAEGTLSATTLALEATESEALSTAFFVMGRDRACHYVAAHANLRAILYQATETANGFRRIVARSSFNDLPLDVVAEVAVPGDNIDEMGGRTAGRERGKSANAEN